MNYPEIFGTVANDEDEKKTNYPEIFGNKSDNKKLNYPEIFASAPTPQREQPQKPWYGDEPAPEPVKPENPVEEYYQSLAKYRNPAASVIEGLKGVVPDIPKAVVTHGGNLLTGFNRHVTAPALGVLGEVVNKLNPLRPAYGSGVRPEGVPDTIGPATKEPISVSNIGTKISDVGDYIGEQSEELNNIIGEHGLDPNKHPELQRFLAGAGELTGMAPAFIFPGALLATGAITGANEARKSGDSMISGAFTGGTKGALDDIIFRKTGKLLPKNAHAKLASMLGFATVHEVSKALETGELSLPDVETAISALTPLAMPGHGGRAKVVEAKPTAPGAEAPRSRPEPEPRVETPMPERTMQTGEPFNINSLIERAKRYGIKIPDEIAKKYVDPEKRLHDAQERAIKTGQGEVVEPKPIVEPPPSATVVKQGEAPLDVKSMMTERFGGAKKAVDIAKENIDPKQVSAPHDEGAASIEAQKRAVRHITFRKRGPVDDALDIDPGSVGKSPLQSGEFKAEIKLGNDGLYKGEIKETAGMRSGEAEGKLSNHLAELNAGITQKQPTPTAKAKEPSATTETKKPETEAEFAERLAWFQGRVNESLKKGSRKVIETTKPWPGRSKQSEPDEQFSMRQPGQRPYTPERPPVGIDLPELVQLTKELSGKLPRVKEKIKAGEAGTAQGSFSQSKKSISIEAALGSNTPEARSTLGHEIGHLVDYLGEKFPNTLKRGNLLGHIAAMKDYLKGMLPEFPGAEGELTPADKLLIRGEAIRQAAKEAKGADIKVDPKEVLDVWNTVDARSKDPKLYDYVSKLGKQKKIDLVKNAINGIFPDWFTFKRNYGAANKTEKQFYDELILKEIKRRGLYDLDEIKTEAYNLSKEWRPFDERADAKYTEYRKKPSELYADMFSVLVNDPALLAEKAPTFHKAFWSYLEERPEVKKQYEGMLNQINSSAHKTLLEKRTFDMFERGDKVREEIAKQGSGRTALKANLRSAWAQMATYMEPLLHYEKMAKDINPNALHSAKWALERLLYVGSEYDNYLRGFNREVMVPLKEHGVDYKTFRYYTFLNEVRSETQPQKFTALGWTPERARESLSKLESQMGSAKFALMENSKKNLFTNVRRNFILDNPDFEFVYGKKLADMFRSRFDYQTHSVIDHLEKLVGSQAGGSLGGKIFKRVGSFSEIEDPIAASTIKDMSLIRSTRRNVAANELKSWLEKYLPDKVSEKKGGALDSEIYFMRDGEVKTFFVEAPIARMFEKNPLESNGITRIMGRLSAPFKASFTTLNPGFYLTNPIRDIGRTVSNVKGMTLSNFLGTWFKSIPEARRFVGNKGNTPNLDKMFRENMITSTVNKAWDTADVEMDRLLKKYDIGKHRNVIGRFFESMTNVLKVEELATKMAGEKWLQKNKPGMTPAERGHIIRTQVGTPDTLMRGDIGAFLNNAMLYYNVNLQGWRGNIAAAKDHPTEWAWKQVKYSIAPKIIMAAAAAGLLGDETKKVMAGFSNYLKQNFHIIPIGITKGGKSVGLSIPMDETQRIIGGLADMAINKLFGNEDGRTLSDAIKFIGSQTIPGANPFIDLVGDTMKYIYGEDITDNFRGGKALSDRERLAGGPESLAKFAKYEFTRFFSVIKKFQSDNPSEVHGELEKILRIPIIGNPISRFIRVTDYGISEKLQAAQKDVNVSAARKSLALDSAIREKINSGVKSRADIIKTYNQFKKDGLVDKKTTKYQFEKKFKRLTKGETPLERQLMYSASNDEKIAIINRSKDLMKKEELNKLLRDYFNEGLISREVYLKTK